MARAPLDRRTFLQSAGAGLAVATVGATLGRRLLAADDHRHSLKKAVKFDMIRTGGSIEDKLNLVKRLGFEGVEMDSPSNVDFAEAARASEKTGVTIHGMIDSIHWKTRFSDPNPDVRAKAVAALIQALKDAKTVGADTVLVVPAKVDAKRDESYEQCRQRSLAEIAKALPTAQETGVKIAIEVVWNDFITTPDQFVEYIDAFKSPYVGGYFDCSNMVYYGVPPAEWIRKLGKRMLKFDFKGYDLEKGRVKKNDGWVKIGEGTEDWPAILKALEDIQYHGWATAEVEGGGEKELKDIADRMNKCLGLS